ncbi:MAG TPA: restriction endonuclease subunit S [Flavobacterium sp.]|nr:restriction endonuclease subunit S [Flavobacterium sp.]
MEGLEISEVYFSKISFENSVFRIDAEYFKKQYLKEDCLRKKYETVYLGEDYFITDGQHGYHEVDENSNIRHLTAKNFKNWFANDIDADRLAKWVDDNNRRSSLKRNDIVLTTRGTVGCCAIVKDEVLPANIDQDVARIAVTNHNRIRPQYLVTFLNSKFGQDWALRNQTGMVQQGLALWRVRELPIPKLNDKFQEQIEKVIEHSHSTIINSQDKYTQAENLLLETLNLKDFQLSKEPVNIKNFSESFGSSGRLDAEYYQVKYEDYLEFIQSYSYGVEPLNEICEIKDKNFNPSEKIEYKYIELANIGKSGEILGCTIDYGSELPTRARRKVNTNDVIISSIEGSLESCALVTKEYDNALCSTGFYVVKSEKLNPETLLVLFKSEPIQALLKKGCSGTILTAISKTELERIPIPLIDTETQNKIKEQINKSFELRNQSEHLLEVAKTAVEMAIEKDEKTAMEYIVNEIEMKNNE